MKKSHKNLPTGNSDWGISITSAKAGVELAITGPNGGHYPGDWATPEQAEEIGLAIIHSAQDARDKANK